MTPVRQAPAQRLSDMRQPTTGGMYDAGLDTIYVLEGDWSDGTLYNFYLCECGKWDAWVSSIGGNADWLLYFRDRCNCEEHELLEECLGITQGWLGWND